MFPDKFVNRIRLQEYIDAENLLKSLEEPSPVSIRINPVKWNREPLDAKPVPWCSSGFYLNHRPGYTFDPLFHAGCFYPQEASGMFIEQVFRQIAGSPEQCRVLDLCGAPGGKSTHLSSLIGSDSLLVTNEVIKSRAFVLAENIVKWGITNTIVTQNDPHDFSELTDFFDIILVDAPCSGEGMFRDGVAVNEWSVANTHHCAERQKRILSDIWPALKKNGILIYSTCTFNPGENEQNIKWILTGHLAESVEINTSDFKGIVNIDFEGIKGYGFYPDRTKGEGFFISVLKKTGSADKVLPRIQKKRWMEPNKPDLKIVNEWTRFKADTIIKKGDQIISFPGFKDDCYLLHQHLKIIYSGTRIGSVKRNGFVPDHELALSDGIIKDAFPLVDLDYHKAICYLRRENFSFDGIPSGWFIAAYSGINLGFCNNIGKRINNYYPVDWRIRKHPDENTGGNLIGWK